jgi:hypothetical protein
MQTSFCDPQLHTINFYWKKFLDTNQCFDLEMKIIIMVNFFRPTRGQDLKKHGEKLPDQLCTTLSRAAVHNLQNLEISLLSANSAKEKLMPQDGPRTPDLPGRKYLPATSV